MRINVVVKDRTYFSIKAIHLMKNKKMNEIVELALNEYIKKNLKGGINFKNE